jgi:hypothetical protein
MRRFLFGLATLPLPGVAFGGEKVMMGRKTAPFFLLFGVGLVFAALGIGANVVPMAAAQTICPPGQTFVIAQGKCVTTQPTTQPAVRCPQGQVFDAQTNRCVTAQVRCPQGQEFDAQTNRCVTAQVRCPQGQEFDAQTNRCVTAQPAVRCPQGQVFDAQTNRCVTAGLVPSLPGLPSPQR